ncbi:hypothetical protein DWX17_12780 [[Clostridium] innocuum]|nr:hypothetical protein DWX17_12780 [[Clostridium] innocuum]
MAFRYTHANCFTDMMLLHQLYKVKKTAEGVPVVFFQLLDCHASCACTDVQEIRPYVRICNCLFLI